MEYLGMIGGGLETRERSFLVRVNFFFPQNSTSKTLKLPKNDILGGFHRFSIDFRWIFDRFSIDFR